MDPALWAALGGGAALLLVTSGFLLATWRLRAHDRAAGRTALDAARADVEQLRERVEELSAQLERARTPAPGWADPQSGFVITTAGEAPRSDLPQVPERAVLSVTVGEPLVKLAAFGYGLRRALSAESRNRIAFEMRREVKRSRKLRRRAARRTRPVDAARDEEAA